ncbi:MAG: patatin-like phospholipase family protein [Candidatus Rokubacteria bacterium]|nr:patatin-like phospholipase family protein [Candidatus Rokubacteria bacterium]
MPFGSEGIEPGIGLALSGGGFRATLFHCGALWRLNELGYLPKLTRVSSVSGGSITAGRLAVRWRELLFVNDAATNFLEEVILPLRKFCERDIDGPAILEGTFLPWKRISDALREEYEDLFGATTLQDLPEAPRFIFNASNFSTGVDFRFSRPYAGDYRIGLLRNPTFSVALAVTASSAFPPFLSPVVITPNPDAFERTDGADLYDHRAYRERLVLTDGGAYDNLGLETVWKRLETILVSDAGAPFVFDPDPGSSWHRQTLRAFDIATNQARGLRKRFLIEMFKAGVRKGTYWGIMTEIENYQLPDALPVPAEVTRKLARIRTRLNPFTEAEQCALINWGYAVCDAAMRKYVAPGALPPPSWPYPECALDQGLPLGVKVEETTDLVDVRSAP